MALIKCRECGQNVSTEARSCPSCGKPNPTISSSEQDKSALLATMGCIGVPLLIFLGFCSYISSNTSPPPRRSTATTVARSQNIPFERYEAVKRAIESSSAGVTIVRDPSAQNTFRIYVPGGFATAYQARQLAVQVRERLGEKAIVYVKDDTGYTLAKAAPWGVESSEPR